MPLGLLWKKKNLLKTLKIKFWLWEKGWGLFLRIDVDPWLHNLTVNVFTEIHDPIRHDLFSFQPMKLEPVETSTLSYRKELPIPTAKCVNKDVLSLTGIHHTSDVDAQKKRAQINPTDYQAINFRLGKSVVSTHRIYRHDVVIIYDRT